MSDFYVCTILLTDLMMLAMILHVIHYTGFKKEQKVWYITTFATIMVCAIAEFAVHCGIYYPDFAWLLTLITIIQFSLAPILGILFMGALGLKKQGRLALGYFLFNLLFQSISAPFKFVFYFDEAGYHRGSGFLAYSIIYFISLAYLLVGLVIVGRKFNQRDRLTIGMVLVVLNAGIVPMTLKEIHITYLAIAISASLCYIYYNDLVQHDVKEELVKNQKRISDMQTHMISGLANVIENRDIETGEHTLRTSRYVKMLAKYARTEGLYTDIIDDHFVELMYTLAPMHDIGKILVSDKILKKPGKLTTEEYEKMKDHAKYGGKVVRDVLSGVSDDEYVSFASDIATYHHERWDGSGYPNGLKGEEIPLSARIMAIADVFDALVSDRCYKKAIQSSEAFLIIEDEMGSHFDPLLAKVFLKYKDEFEKSRAEKL